MPGVQVLWRVLVTPHTLSQYPDSQKTLEFDGKTLQRCGKAYRGISDHRRAEPSDITRPLQL
jgi:hypothetical protein